MGDLLPSREQAALMATGGAVLLVLAFLRNLGHSMSAHSGELLAIARDTAAAALAITAALALLLTARSVARREGRHCAPPDPAPAPRPAQQPGPVHVPARPGQAAYSYRLRPPALDDDSRKVPLDDLLAGGDR